jgi:hypothetical protein
MEYLKYWSHRCWSLRVKRFRELLEEVLVAQALEEGQVAGLVLDGGERARQVLEDRFVQVVLLED